MRILLVGRVSAVCTKFGFGISVKTWDTAVWTLKVKGVTRKSEKTRKCVNCSCMSCVPATPCFTMRSFESSGCGSSSGFSWLSCPQAFPLRDIVVSPRVNENYENTERAAKLSLVLYRFRTFLWNQERSKVDIIKIWKSESHLELQIMLFEPKDTQSQRNLWVLLSRRVWYKKVS